MIEQLENRIICSATTEQNLQPKEIHAPLGITITPITGTISGTLTQRVSASIDLRIATPTRATNIYSQINTTQVIFNPTRWMATIDVTFASIYNSLSGQQQPLNMINSQFGLAADHFKPAIGSICYFADNNGKVYGRTVVASRSYTIDLAVVKLDSPLPSSIHPATLLPNINERAWEYFDYIGGDIPIVILDQENKALISKIRSLGEAAVVSTSKPGTNRIAFYEPKIAGDSGHAMFLVYGDKPILVGHINGTGNEIAPDPEANGPAYHWRLTTIRNAMAAMGGQDQSLTIFDLTGAVANQTIQYTIKPRPTISNLINTTPKTSTNPIFSIPDEIEEIENPVLP